MNSYQTSKNTPTRRIQLTAAATALALALMGSPPRSAHADHDEDVTPPPVPTTIQVPVGNTAFLKGFAVGTQNYMCLSSGAGYAWTFFGPQATLFDDEDKQIITHFLSANPDESGTPRATWQHSKDTSAIWARVAPLSTPVSVPGAIPWLLLEVVGDQDGPTGGHKLTTTTYIQRLNTTGGVAPATGCATVSDIGKRALVSYTADYFFYKATKGDDDE